MLTEGQDKIKETLSISDKISDILSEEADAGSQHVIDSWLAQNEQNKALFNKICSDNTIRKKIYNYKNSDAEQAFNNFLKANNVQTAAYITGSYPAQPSLPFASDFGP